jgi:hypothetical protein
MRVFGWLQRSSCDHDAGTALVFGVSGSVKSFMDWRERCNDPYTTLLVLRLFRAAGVDYGLVMNPSLPVLLCK